MTDAKPNSKTFRRLKERRVVVSAILTLVLLALGVAVGFVITRSDSIPDGYGVVDGRRTQFVPVPTGPDGIDLSDKAEKTARPGLVEARKADGSGVGEIAKSVQTGKDGKFRFVLLPGVYRIVGGQDGCLEETVNVFVGKSIDADLKCGSK